MLDLERRLRRLFIVFAKVGGDKNDGLHNREAFVGTTAGAEKRNGLAWRVELRAGLDRICQGCPVENVLGEIGLGHVIAFHCP